MKQKPILKLNRVILNNWGSGDHIEIKLDGRCVMFVGPNGSGKTTALDAVITDTFGTFDSNNYNLAQPEQGEHTRRFARDYYLGRRHYKKPVREGKFFNSSVVSEWYDESEDKFYCTGFVTEMTPSEQSNAPDALWFTLNGPAPKDGFRNYGRDDIKKLCEERKKKYSSVSPMVSQVYPNNNSYTEAVMKTIFGNVDKNKFKKLQRSSIRMRIEGPTDQFIKDFLFPREETNDLGKLSTQLKSFTEAQRLLESNKANRDQLIELEKFLELFLSADDDYKDICSAVMYLTEVLYQRQIDRYSKQKEEAEAAKTELEGEKDNCQSAIKALENEIIDINSALSSSQYETKRQALDNKRTQLKNEEASKQRFDKILRGLKAWTDNKATDDYVSNPLIHRMEEFEKTNVTEESLKDIRRLFAETKIELEEACSTARNEYETAKKVRMSSEDKLKDLKDDKKQYRNQQQLMNAKKSLEARLSDRYGHKVKVDIFSRTFNIADDEWRNAIEGRLGEKSSLIVEPKYMDEASRILRKLNSSGVRLIDSKKHLNSPVEAKKGSLYEAVSSDRDYIDAALKFYLGRIIKCETEEELRASENGVTKDCYSYSNRQYYRIPDEHYTRYASIGREITRKEIQAAEDELHEAQAEERATKESYDALAEYTRYEDLSKYTNEEILGYVTDIKNIGKTSKEVKNLEDTVRKLRDGKIKELEEQLRIKSEEKERLSSSLTGIITSISNKSTEITQLNARLEASKSGLATAASKHPQLSDRAKEVAADWTKRHPTMIDIKDMEDDFADRKEELLDKRQRTHETLVVEKNRYINSHPTSCLDNSDATNALILTERENSEKYVKESLIPEFEKASKDVWDNITQTLIISLNSQIDDARHNKSEINRVLKDHPFGKSVYELSVEPADGEMGDYYRMLTADELKLVSGNSLIDENNLVFNYEYFYEKYRDLIDRFISLFVEPELTEEAKNDPEQKELYEARRKKYEDRIRFYSDYRNYMKFQLKERERGENTEAVSVAAKSASNSAGEKETAKYVAIFAGFYMLYRNRNKKGRRVTPGLVLMDEALKKLDRERSQAIIEYIRTLGLQVIMCGPDKDISLIEFMDSLVTFQPTHEDIMQIGFIDRRAINKWYNDEGEEADAEVPSPYQDSEDALKKDSEFDPDNYRQMTFDDYGGLQ